MDNRRSQPVRILLADEKPDILLLDLAMPRMPGLEALREMSSGPVSNSVRVILLTAAAEKKQIVEALQLGARGVVLKDSATQLLLKSIHTVMSGEYWVGRESVSNLVQYLRNLVQSSGEEAKQKKFGLTPRELEIVSAVVAGYSNKEIAEYFKISEDTVKHHLSNIFDKLGVSTRPSRPSPKGLALWCYVFPQLGYWQFGTPHLP